MSADWNTVDQATGYRLFYAPYPQATQINSIDMGINIHLSVDLWAGASAVIYRLGVQDLSWTSWERLR